ncbi:Reverse transcriptase (RNA-dependent DNA polymerase) [Phytophthora infestans]|uniref:Reverse transcriptase (RNA-dependent DNA polymerase) n=1 Tax=Phytophthora infestans TaxID=4787 RepID=A0A8S9UY64_PHYIN|nr:Reverse transcriptase (RNA-dependent DNA polymerase) [Phytophthora infestans]
MSTETKRFMKNGTFKKVELPGGRSAIKSEWVLKKKSNADGSLNKYKARLVAKNFSQRYDEDYSETFSPVASKYWYKTLTARLVGEGSHQGEADYCLFSKKKNSMAGLMIIIVNVDESWVFALRDEGLPSFTTFMEGVNKVNSLEDKIEQPAGTVKSGVKHVFRYLKSTRDNGLVFKSDADKGLAVYCDAVFAVERDSNSATGHSVYYDGCLVGWGSKKQVVVTLSSTEAEYIAMGTGV